MFTFEELAARIGSYQTGSQSLADFQDWFEENCSGAYDDSELRAACIAVDAALSEYYYDHVGESVLRKELATAIRPFALPDRTSVSVRYRFLPQDAPPKYVSAGALATAAVIMALTSSPKATSPLEVRTSTSSYSRLPDECRNSLMDASVIVDSRPFEFFAPAV